MQAFNDFFRAFFGDSFSKKLPTLLQRGAKLASPLRSSMTLRCFISFCASLLSCFVTPLALFFLLVLRYYSLCFVALFSCIAVAWCFATPLCFIVPLPTQIPFCLLLFGYSFMVAFLTSFINRLNIWSNIVRNVSQRKTCSMICQDLYEVISK
jgi:hypothetical protein